jgi:hypothetical protein
MEFVRTILARKISRIVREKGRRKGGFGVKDVLIVVSVAILPFYIQNLKLQ